MEGITDFYEALNLDASMSTEDLSAQLRALERTWMQRQINMPEKAAEMLALIRQAIPSFADDNARAAYDQALAESRQPKQQEDPDAARMAEIEKWKQEATDYYNKAQYDLAMIAVDKAMQAAGMDTPDVQLHFIAANIFLQNRQHFRAIDSINRIILMQPDSAEAYLLKGDILNDQLADKNLPDDQRQKLIKQVEDAYRICDELAEKTIELPTRAKAKARLAFLMLVHRDDQTAARSLAYDALDFDSSEPQAKMVLDMINQQQNEKYDLFHYAEEARKNGNFARAQQLYEQCIPLFGDLPEAYFFNTFCKVMQYDFQNPHNAFVDMNEIIPRAVSLIPKRYTDEKDRIGCLVDFHDALIEVMQWSSKQIKTLADSNISDIMFRRELALTNESCSKVFSTLYFAALQLGIESDLCSELKKRCLTNAIEFLVDNLNDADLRTCIEPSWIERYQTALDQYAGEMKKLDPSYQLPTVEKQTVVTTKSTSGHGCYIATAVYGSYDCPNVWTLRRFRDNMLAPHWYGRAFIRCYYAISPTLVRWFGKSEWFNRFWKRRLDALVASLHNQGVADTPYEDRDF